jgi:hypothetical protein
VRGVRHPRAVVKDSAEVIHGDNNPGDEVCSSSMHLSGERRPTILQRSVREQRDTFDLG